MPAFNILENFSPFPLSRVSVMAADCSLISLTVWLMELAGLFLGPSSALAGRFIGGMMISDHGYYISKQGSSRKNDRLER